MNSTSAQTYPATAFQQQQPEMLTPEQLALRLGVSRRTVGNWTRQKMIPMLKIGRVCRFDYAKVRAVLEQYEHAASPAPHVIQAASLSTQRSAAPTPSTPASLQA